MKRTVFRFFLMVFLIAGCGVTKDVYQKTVEESEARKASLEQAQNEIAQLAAKVDELSKQVDSLSSEKESLSSEIDALKMEKGDLASALADVKKRLEELTSGKEMASEMQKKLDAVTEELATLKKEKEELQNKADYLNREVERLRVKAGELSAEKEKEVQRLQGTYENLVKEMKSEIEKGEIKITQALDRLSVNLVEKILFDSGKAEIKPEGLKVLKRVGTILKGITDKQIRIEGHTDNVKIGTRIKSRYASNWELSTARANNVVRYLQDKVGVDPKFLFAAGYSEYQPIASNNTTEGRAQNRRIEIVLLPLDVDKVLEELKEK